MFTKIHANGVMSSDGFTVEIVNMKQLRYIEGSITLSVPLEMLMGSCDFAVYLSHIRSWDVPHQNEIIDAGKLSIIQERIEGGLSFLGLNIRFG